MQYVAVYAGINVWIIEARHVYGLHILYRHRLAKEVAQVNLSILYLIPFNWETRSSRLVHIVDIAKLVKGNGINHWRIKDRLIAQLRILYLFLTTTSSSDITGCTHNISGLSISVIAQGGEHNGKYTIATIFLILRTYLKGYLIFLTFRNFQQGITNALYILCLHALEEECRRLIGSFHLTIFIIKRHRLLAYIEGPDAYLVGLHNQRQAIITTTDGFGHLLFTIAIDDIIDGSTYHHQYQDDNHWPYPRGHTTILTLWIEPLVLNSLQLTLRLQQCVYLVYLL